MSNYDSKLWGYTVGSRNLKSILPEEKVDEAVLIKPIYEAKLPEITLGKFKIQIIGNFRSTNPFLSGNNQAVISVSIDGKPPKKFGTFKQGMIKIWAFPLRPKMSGDEQNKFDKFMDANWDKTPKLK